MRHTERRTPPEGRLGGRTVAISTSVNGRRFRVTVPSRLTLAELLRENFNLTGTKLGCNRAECGVCTVLMDGEAVYSCTVLAAEANNRTVETVEGLAAHGKLHALQEAFVREDALQCGFCTPGLLMSLKSLLDKNKEPTLEDVKKAVDGNYCRCGAYPNIFKAVLEAARVSSQEEVSKEAEAGYLSAQVRSGK